MSQFSPTIISNTKSYELFTSFQQNTEPHLAAMDPTNDATHPSFCTNATVDRLERNISRDNVSMGINTEWLV